MVDPQTNANQTMIGYEQQHDEIDIRRTTENENMSYTGSSNYRSFSDDAATLEQLVGASMLERSLSNKTIMNNNHLVMA